MFKTRKWNIVLALALCALLLPTTVSAKKPAEQRAVNTHGESTIVLDLASGVWTKTYCGWGSHCGYYTGKGSGIGNTGSRWLISTRSDRLDWHIVLTTMDIADPENVHIAGDATITGGTGRFEYATGSGDVEYNGIMVVHEWGYIDGVPVPLRATLTLTYTVKGRMTY